MTKVLVVGDSCTDIFIYCSAQRLAPDFPVPVLSIDNRTENPGMAQNVRRNIESLLSHESGECDIITNCDWKSVTKTRYVHKDTNHMFFRVDSSGLRDKFENDIDYSAYDIVVVSDYDKGFLSSEDIEMICDSHPRVFLDTKKKIDTWAENAFIIKINDYEYQSSYPFSTSIANKIVHTMGSRGAEYQGIIYPARVAEVQDLSGAGDTFLAALVVGSEKTGSIISGIKFANYCAAEIVRHRGVNSI